MQTIRKMVAQTAKLKSKLARETLAVAYGATINSTISEFDPNTNRFFDHFFQLFSFPYLSRRVVSKTADFHSVDQDYQHSSHVLDVHQRQPRLRSERNSDWVHSQRRFEYLGTPGRRTSFYARAYHPRDAERHKLDRPFIRKSGTYKFDGSLRSAIRFVRNCRITLGQWSRRERTVYANGTGKDEPFDMRVYRLPDQFHGTVQIHLRSGQRVGTEGARQNAGKVDHGSNWMGLKQPQYIILQPEITG